MLKVLKNKFPLIALAGVSALSLGFLAAFLEVAGVVKLPRQLMGNGPTVESSQENLDLSINQASKVAQLTPLPVEKRAEELNKIAEGPPSTERSQARYLLAVDLINQGKGGSAISVLAGLEEEYPTLAPYILLKRGQAQAAAGLQADARATWLTLTKTYGENAAVAEALYELGRQAGQYWDQMLQEFPTHPRSVEVAYKRLTADPARADALELMRIVVNHGLFHPEVEAVMDRMTAEFSRQLNPEDWQAIGFGYWEIQKYGKAGPAYAKAPSTPENAYRAARGLEIGKRWDDAIVAYRLLKKQFPNAPETATGLLKLVDLVKRNEAIVLLDQVLRRFPDRAGEALVKRAKLLDELNSSTSAMQARQSVLTQYSPSEAAARLRLRWAKEQARASNYKEAWNWAQQLVKENPDSELAPQAAFWLGKWALRLGKQREAGAAFKQVIAQYPESYYAWRSAVWLGWDVGDFTSVRNHRPQLALPTQRAHLPAGSKALQELYQLGQDQDAWRLWQTEFTNPQQPTVAEQFTDGLMRLGVGDNLDGIFMLSSLAWRDDPKEKADYETLKNQPAYWRSLYPFPFAEKIGDWSQQVNLNPLLVTALIRQESRFEPQIRSVVGAVGLMQVMPSTADWIQGQIDVKTYDLDNPNDNIRFGTWYLDYTHREYNNNSLFAIASYNAGPGNVADWIRRNNFADADEFVDVIPFPETKDYVQAVFGGYWNYLRLYNPQIAKQIQQYNSLYSSLQLSPPLQ
ncbi:MAG: transglycosylase SLT domain-containing protein [Leptolyngbyaceae cyanobacterium MO_188.B28]|nr:transglycosylase SLT domain-containing protein [Leptolyngbyaceae cyanobacterium MO_188.B28]